MPRDPYQELIINEALRRDPKRQAAKRTEKFLNDRQAERQSKLGETSGLGDLLTFLPAANAAKALKSGQIGNSAVNALAFTSQFDDSKLGGDVQDALAMFPVFGFGSTKGLAKGQDRLRKLAERGVQAELPILSEKGKMAPARLKQFEKRIRAYIEDSSAKDTSKTLGDLDKWLETLNTTKPVDKRVLFDRMPASLRPGLYQAAKEQGYGGISLGTRSKAPMDKYGTRVTKGENLAELEAQGKYTSGGRMNPTQEAPSGPRRWEEINKFEQSGGVPKAWEDKFRAQQQKEVARKYLEQLGIGSAVGTSANLLTGGGHNRDGEDQKAGLIVNKRNIGRLRQLQEGHLDRLAKIRPNSPELNELEAIFAAKYPKIYEKTAKGGSYQTESGFGGGYFEPKSGNITLRAPEDPESWRKRPRLSENVLNTLGHESTHSLDYQRLGKVNDLTTGRKLNADDFGKNYKTIVKLFNEPGIGTIKGAQAAYEAQPIEKRAYKAGATAQKSTSDLLLGLVDPATLKAPKVKKSWERRKVKRFEELNDVTPAKDYELTLGENLFGGTGQ